MNWNENNDKLTAEIRFKSQTELAEYVLDVAKYADQVNHHPDYQIHKCSVLKVSLSTHDKNAITEKDYALAKEMELIYNKRTDKN